MTIRTDFNYFTLRSVDPSDYDEYTLPTYLRPLLPLSQDAAILDIGCGYGQLLRAISAEGYSNVSGIDISEEAVIFCKQYHLNVIKIKSISDYCYMSHTKYDLIIMSHVLEHVEKSEIIVVLETIRNKLLSPTGDLVIMVPNAQSHTGCYWAYEDFTHTTLFTSGSLYYVLKASGFHNVTFLDCDGLSGTPLLLRPIKWILIRLYLLNFSFWNRVTGSSFHRQSPCIITYEIKAVAR